MIDSLENCIFCFEFELSYTFKFQLVVDKRVLYTLRKKLMNLDNSRRRPYTQGYQINAVKKHSNRTFGKKI